MNNSISFDECLLEEMINDKLMYQYEIQEEEHKRINREIEKEIDEYMTFKHEELFCFHDENETCECFDRYLEKEKYMYD